MPFSVHSLYRHIFKIWRAKRFKLFLNLIQPSENDIILDVGGIPWDWVSQPPAGKRLDTLNIYPVDYHANNFPQHKIQTLEGDGCALNMPDKSYDIGFSNSVIEHVGSWERQQQFAAEIRRVANALWVQTPAYECPIEPHYMTPFIHYLPQSLQKKLLRWFTPFGWIERPNREEINSMVETTRLLRKSEMHQLFPDCQILTERLLWVIPKSYIVFRPKNSSLREVM
ncbi:MAG: methyltransferase domain-containing protein [Limisphaerales bacterium]